MSEAKKLAKLVKNAAALHEGSWDKVKQEYNYTIQEAVFITCAEDQALDEVVCMLLTNNWNESLDWSAAVLAT